jgi:hypothetical protein
MENGMTAALPPEQRSLIEDYLAKTEAEEAACLWRNIIGAQGAGVAWREIGWLAEMHGVPEEVVEVLLTGLDLIDWDGQSRDRLLNEGDPWSAFRAIGIDVPRPGPTPQVIASRDDVRAAYDDAIREIEQVRGTHQFEDGFHGRVADAVFDACYSALKHYSACVEQKGPVDIATRAQLRATKDTQANTVQPRLHVLSAPMGTGKTTFSMAFMAAITRLAESYPEMPLGCALLVDQIVKADDRFRELSQLLPGKIAVWTSDHDVDCTQPVRLSNPAARFHVDELQHYPVIVVTHAFYKAERGDKARYVFHDGQRIARALTVVDEQMEDVPVYDVLLSQAEGVREKLQGQEQSERAQAPMLTLVKFMASKAFDGKGLEKPSDDQEAWKIADELHWFTSEQAKQCATNNWERIPRIKEVFGFARSMANGCAFIARYHNGAKGTHFVGYEPQFTMVPGMVLLDATSDIDGVTSLCPWRTHIEVPRVRYDNLSIVHVDCYTDEKNLSKYFVNKSNRLSYAEWMLSVIREHMEPGQRGLAVCKKVLVDERNVPDWPLGDPRFGERLKFTEDFGWELDARLLSVTYWGGNGIGSNVWRDAEVVFLFGEFFLPRRTHIGATQGLQLAKASSGSLASMEELQSKAVEVEGISEGHLLRWTKQMALRGRGRFFDGQGVCGEQKLVVTGDYERLLLHKDRMFPGAKLTVSRPDDDLSRYKTWRRRLLEVLSNPELPHRVTTKEIGERLKIKWADVSGDIMTDETAEMLKALGWAYVPRRGRGGSSFERIETQEHRAGQPGEAMAAE